MLICRCSDIAPSEKGFQIGLFSCISFIASISSMCYSSGMAGTAQRPITLPQTEHKQVEELEAMLNRGNAALVSSAGERIDLPNTVYEILRKVVTLMAHG